ncbi:hypothetical protein NX059_002456 [Plenodomus lindquistii]|nr:hypothetical protein NX059_002456 [Plenodomus lindquistii]
MSPKPNDPGGKGEHATTDDDTARTTVHTDADLPIYYNSEPSSQPPQYADKMSTQSQPASAEGSKLTTASHAPQPQHRHNTPAATVSAVLASPHDDLDAQRRADRKSKTLRERWKDFKGRNFGEYGEETYGSASEWNVQGSKMGGGLATPYRRAERK